MSRYTRSLVRVRGRLRLRLRLRVKVRVRVRVGVRVKVRVRVRSPRVGGDEREVRHVRRVQARIRLHLLRPP